MTLRYITIVLCIATLTACKKPAEQVADIAVEEVYGKEHLYDALQPDSTSQQKAATRLEIFSYTDDLCQYKGYYHPETISLKEIEGAYALWRDHSGSIESPGVFHLRNLHEIRTERDNYLNRISKQYQEARKKLTGLTLPKDPYWHTIHKTDLQELEDYYELVSTEAKAFTRPEILKTSRFNTQCAQYADALTGGKEHLLKVWETHVQSQGLNNADPERLMQNFRAESQSTAYLDYAYINLITFGWGNCANDQIKRAKRDEAMNRKFKALFTRVETVECDEP